MTNKIDIAIAGSTGNVGREILQILEQREFPINNIYCLASSRSKGKKIKFKGQEIEVEDLAKFDFSKVQLSLFSPGGSISAKYAPKATKEGCIVIDNTSHFRMNDDVPLVVPEVNSDILQDFFNNNSRSNIIANPNCSTIQMVMALKPLYDFSKIKRVIVSTYQSTSGAGRKPMDELFEQTKNIFENKQIKKKFFTKQIAFNVIPHIDNFLENGETKEEWKMRVETKKILDKSIEVFSTCVRVPVFIGHAESVNIEFEKPISDEKAKQILKKSPGVSVVDYRKDEGYITPEECAGEDYVFVSRIRKDETVKNGLALWIVSDNLRKGAALNAVQIAETIIKNKLLKN